MATRQAPNMTLCVAPALIPSGPSLQLPADAPVSAGPSFEGDLTRLQREYRLARGGEKGAALRRLRDAMHREMAKEINHAES